MRVRMPGMLLAAALFLSIPCISQARWEIEILQDPIDDEFSPISHIALDPEGRPHFTCRSSPQGLLHSYFDADGWHTDIVETGEVVRGSSIVADSKGYLHVSYLSEKQGIKYAFFDGAKWTRSVVDKTGRGAPSIALDVNNGPQMSYAAQEGTYAVKHARYEGNNWIIETVSPPDADISDETGTSLALSKSGKAHISFNTYQPMTVYWASNESGTWNAMKIGTGGEHSSIALDSAGRPHVVWDDAPGGTARYSKYDGSKWVRISLPRAIGLKGPPFGLDISIDSKDFVHLCFDLYHPRDYDFPNRTIYARFDGKYWIHDVVEKDNAHNRYASIAVEGGNVHVGFLETELFQQDAFLNYAKASSLKLLKIMAVDTEATESGVNKAGFAVIRTGDIRSPLKVPYQIRGTAENGIDYELLSEEVTIPAHETSAMIDVSPLADGLTEKPETVRIKILPVAGYKITPPEDATVKIMDGR